MESIKKFNDLITGQPYTVSGYSDPINSLYGTNYILLVNEQNSTESFELRSTNSLAQYITDKKPKDKFTFVVNEQNGAKYLLIERYKKDIVFTMLN